MKLERMIRSLISYAVVGARQANGWYQAAWIDDRVSADIEHLQPQGVHFAVPSGAAGMLLATGAVQSASVLLCASGSTPTAPTLAAGEGGLHLLGTFKVFLAADGTVALGAPDAADFVALASKVDAAVTAIQAAFDTHTHVVATTGTAAAQSGTAAAVLSPIGPQPPTGSATVRAE